jgi:acylphosphatase
MVKHLKIKVLGRVQKVWYRAKAGEKAIELELKGFVENQPDGSVYIEAEGDEEALGQFLKWCHKGPVLARVDSITTKEGDLRGYEAFTIRR